MAYIVPQALVYQEFRQIPSEITAPLRACIVGGNAQLIRFAEASEKEDGELGAYNSVSEEAFEWPNRMAGGVVDQSYVKLFIQDALLEYLDDAIGQGGTVVPVSGKLNRVRSSNLGFISHGSFSRSAALLDRDVQVGDVVYLRGVVEGDNYTLWTSVQGFAYETVAAVIASSSGDENNAEDQSDDVAVTKTDGADNCIDLTADITSYDGLTDGGIYDIYTVTVIQSSVDGDLTTARCRLTSASGNDDVASFAPAAVGDDKTVGARGLVLTFDLFGAGSSCSAEVGEGAANDLIAGQTWEVEVTKSFVAPGTNSDGTYTGDLDTTYVVEVTRGGLWSQTDTALQPQYTVYTVHGTDITPPKNAVANSVYYPIGTEGVTMRWTGGTGLRKGDKYLINVTAASNGRASTLILANNLGELVDATDLDLKLYIKSTVQVPQYLDGDLDVPHWTGSTTEITVKSGIQVYHPEWTDSGVEELLPIKGGTMYAEYRAWLPGTASAVNGMSDVGSIDDIPGPLDIDNPLKYGVWSALLNANGSIVKYIGVANPDETASWTTALGKLVGRTDVYNLVPLTHDDEVINSFVGHVTAQSSATAGRWRATVIGLQGAPTVALVDSESSTDGEVVMATLADDPDTSGTQYTLLTVPAGNGEFVTNGVRAGDIARYLFTVDSLGQPTYQEFEIDEVINEDSLRLVSGHTVAISVAQKVEIWRNRTPSEEAEAIGDKAGAYGNRRVVAVWPDYGLSGDVRVDSMYIAAMVAGRRSGVAPHQGMTHIALTGLDSVARTTSHFNADQLNEMASKGVWIVTQDDQTGQIYTRHALTTDMSGLSQQEEMIRTNVDSISYFFLNRLSPFIGVTNVTPTTIAAMRTELSSAINYLKSAGQTPNLGAQLIDAEIARLEQSPVALDRIVIVLNLTLPYPLNNAELYLVI